MARKTIMFLTAAATPEGVRLSGYKTTPGFQDKARWSIYDRIRILRAEEKAYEFGYDYDEYFDGLSWKDAALVFDGPIPAENERRFVWTDRNVEIGRTYAYWMASTEGEPTGPAPVKYRDPEVWWTLERLDEEIARLAGRFPGALKAVTAGYSGEGRPIPAFVAGTGKQCVGLVGAVHAGESGAELMIPAVERMLAEEPQLLRRTRIACLPVANVDCREREARGAPWYIRLNARGVDLNRNFPADWDREERGYGYVSSEPGAQTYRGPRPGSEPETQAVLGFLEDCRPDVLYSFHCLASICGKSFIAARASQADAPYADSCRRFAELYGNGLNPAPLKGKLLHFACSAGSLPAWCHEKLRIPAFDIEMSEDEAEALHACRRDLTDRPMLERYRAMHAEGLRAVLRDLGG